MNAQTLINQATAAGFESYGSFNEGGLQHEILTATEGAYDGEVVDIYYDYHTGAVDSFEVSSQFKDQQPLFKFN
jgi:uncharacterized protein YrrD